MIRSRDAIDAVMIIVLTIDAVMIIVLTIAKFAKYKST